MYNICVESFKSLLLLPTTTRDLLNTLHSERILRSNAAWLKQRQELVRAAVTAETSPLSNLPFIYCGSYRWAGASKDIFLDILFPEFPFAVKIYDRCYGRYTDVQKYCLTRAYWEKLMAEHAEDAEYCSDAKVSVIYIHPDDPIDVYSIAKAIRDYIGPIDAEE